MSLQAVPAYDPARAVAGLPSKPEPTHPAYHEGFYDAQTGEPLFPDAGDQYTHGWHAFYAVKALIARPVTL